MAEGGDPPSAFRIWAWGENRTLKGDLLFDDQAAADIMAAYSQHGVDLVIDYEHQTFNAEDNGKPAPAAGWFTPELRGDGLWATSVRWTDEAATYLRERKYRYFSPVATVDPETRRPSKLLPMALTNWPATQDQEPLVARAPISTEIAMNVNAALGLKADADESQACTAIDSLRGIERDVLLLSGKTTINDAFAVLLAFKEKAARADALDAELVTLKTEKANAEIATLLDAAVRDGRVRPASRSNFETLAQSKGLDALQLCLNELPRASIPALPPAQDAPGVVTGFTPDQLKIVRMIGVEPGAVAKHRAESPAFRAATGKED